jgi:hypothetical protein
LITTGNEGLIVEAGQVVRAMLPYAHPYPWLVFGDKVQQLDGVLRRLGMRPP